jgi:hypothetical protein
MSGTHPHNYPCCYRSGVRPPGCTGPDADRAGRQQAATPPASSAGAVGPGRLIRTVIADSNLASRAGRKQSLKTHFVEANENLSL